MVRYDKSSEVADVSQSLSLSLGLIELELTKSGLILLDKVLALASKSHDSSVPEQAPRPSS